jgi:hypothetical protein
MSATRALDVQLGWPLHFAGDCSCHDCVLAFWVTQVHHPLPLLQEFNRGLFDYLIATDDVHAPAAEDGGKQQQQQQRKKQGGSKEGGGGKKRRRRDEEFGVTRGIDFKGVRTVVNFEMPGSLEGWAAGCRLCLLLVFACHACVCCKVALAAADTSAAWPAST